jgi:arylsulfatase A-like enzyme
MKRIFTHTLTILSLAFAYTKGALISIFLYFIPTYALGLILGCFTIFLSFLYFITKKQPFSWKNILKTALLGSFVGYILQIINMAAYLNIRHLPYNIGFFEDEFYRAVVFLFPCLVVGEIIYHFVKNSFIKQIGFTALVVGFCFFLIKGLLTIDAPQKNYPEVQKTSREKPNVILILADDLGIGDLSFNGQKNYQTPNIDRLVAEGVNFTNAYCSAPICSPSRVGLLTGEYQQRYGFEHLTDGFSTHPYARKADFEKFGHQMGDENTYWWDLEVKKRGIDPQTTTLAEFLKEDGYATAIIGKWHLGMLPRFQPKQHGFDYFLGTYSAGMFYLPPDDTRLVSYFHKENFFERLEHQLMVYQLFENEKPYKTDDKIFTTDLFTQKGLEFIEKNKENRFFLYLPYNAVHGPFQAQKTIYDKLSHIKNHEERVYAAMVTSLDEAVGAIKTKLENLGLDENTIIIFASDNGAPLYFPSGTNQPLYGGKMSCFEGGLRVPFLVYWKNKINPRQYASNVSLMDVFKTVSSAVGKSVPQNVAQDGVDLLPFLVTKDSSNLPHRTLCWRVGYAKAIQQGDWKLDWNEKEGFTNLHNLTKDPTETQNLVAAYPEVVKNLKKDFSEWEKQLKTSNWRHSLDAKVEDGRGQRFYFPW